MTTIGSLGLGMNLNDEVNFDVSGTGVAYASFQNGGFGSTDLYTVDLSSGATILLGTVGNGGCRGPAKPDWPRGCDSA